MIGKRIDQWQSSRLFADNLNSVRRDLAIIAIARMLLAIASGVLMWIEEPGNRGGYDHLVPVLYALRAAVPLWLVAQVGIRKSQVAVHLADIVFAIAMMFAAESALVLFVMLSTFCLLSASAQWSWKTVAATGACLIAAYLVSVSLGYVNQERLLIRTLFLMSATALIAGATQARDAERLKLLWLAKWGTGRLDDTIDSMKQLLLHAANLIEAQIIQIIWRGAEDDGWREAVLCLRTGRLDVGPEAESFISRMPAALRNEAYLMPAGISTCLSLGGRTGVAGAVPSRLQDLDFQKYNVASAPFVGDVCEGRIFVAGPGRWRFETTVLLELVGAQILSRIEGRAIRRKQAQIAAESERARMSRDLHDGLLQSLTAARMKLHVAENAETVEGAKAQIAEAAGLLQTEQIRLRRVVECGREDEGAVAVSLNALGDAIRKLAACWSLDLHVHVSNGKTLVPQNLFVDLHFIASEAVANAARHGDKGVAEARLDVVSERVRLTIENPVRPDAAIREDVRPRSLSQRVTGMGGTIAFSIRSGRAVLELEAPLDE